MLHFFFIFKQMTNFRTEGKRIIGKYLPDGATSSKHFRVVRYTNENMRCKI